MTRTPPTDAPLWAITTCAHLWLQILKGEAEPIEADEIDLEKITAAADTP